jgi:hypothetical protein
MSGVDLHGISVRAVLKATIVLHVHDNPALRPGFVESFVETANVRITVVGPFALGIGVMDVETEARARASSGPLEHLQVAVRIAEGGDGAAANMHVDANGLARLVVNEVQLRQAHQHRRAVAQREFRFDAAARDLLGRDTIHLLRPRPHKLDATARDNDGLEPICSQVGEQLEHGLIHHLGGECASLRMRRGGNPLLDDSVEFCRRHAGVRGHCHLDERAAAVYVAPSHCEMPFEILPPARPPAFPDGPSRGPRPRRTLQSSASPILLCLSRPRIAAPCCAPLRQTVAAGDNGRRRRRTAGAAG